MSVNVPAPSAIRISQLPPYDGDRIRAIDLVPVLYRNTSGSYTTKIASAEQIKSYLSNATSGVLFGSVSTTEVKADIATFDNLTVSNLHIGSFLLSPTLKHTEIVAHTGSPNTEVYTVTHPLNTTDVQVQVFAESSTADYYTAVITEIDSFLDGTDYKVRFYIKNLNNANYKIIIVG